MAAPKGNNFWKLRSKHGRDRLFTVPSLLWEAACEYFQWCEENPLYKQEGYAFQGTVTKEDLSLMRAFTLTGLCIYLDVNTKYFNHFEESLDADNNEVDKDFSNVLTRIREIIYTQKFEGAAAGLLNANIIARDLGLIDKSEAKLNADVSNKTIIEFKNFGKQDTNSREI